MTLYKLSPFAYFIESQLIPNVSQHGVAHRLTGRIVELLPNVQSLLRKVELGTPFSWAGQDLNRLNADGRQLQRLIEEFLLVPVEANVWEPFINHLVVWPLQNPAVTHSDEAGNLMLVRTSMTERVYSPKLHQLSEIMEEPMTPLAGEVFLLADGTKELGEIHTSVAGKKGAWTQDQEFIAALDFLTQPERQLIKLTDRSDLLLDPFQPPNIVPQNLYHSTRWPNDAATKTIAEFHVDGIEDANWEFDVIEPTVNHSLRFPSELLGGLNYGERFCDAALGSIGAREVAAGKQFKVLEVGGGTGSFARSFIQRAQATRPLSYQILDLSPALAESQRRTLEDLRPAVAYTAQDATELDLPGQTFDLIIANEVIADFPVAAVEREPDGFTGDGLADVRTYELSTEDAPEKFYVNSGVFRFLERAWIHLVPGGSLIVSEYTSGSRYPVETYHLNHPEFSIHFGHVTECARRIGYQCSLKPLAEFLSMDESKSVLAGREEHIRCLNHVLEKHGFKMPFALFTEHDFNERFGELFVQNRITPIRFLPLRSNFHYGPNIGEFWVLNLTKPIS